MKLRKLFFLFLTVALFTGFASCSSDDDDDDIVGTWILQEDSYEVISNNTSFSSAYVKEHTSDSDADFYFEFKKDGILVITYTDNDNGEETTETETVSYQYKDGKLIITDSDGTRETPISLKGNTFTISYEDELPSKYEIEYIVNEYNLDVDPATIKVDKVIRKETYKRK